MPEPRTTEWYAAVQEEIINPDRSIIDPHHHLWNVETMWGRYELDDLWADTESGHNIEKTVFIDCRSNYRADGPSHMKPIGETEYVVRIAAETAKANDKATIAGIISHADMRLGKAAEEVLNAHEAAGNGLFRGIRHAGPYDTSGTLSNRGGSKPCPYSQPAFREGVETLGKMGYTYDTWHFHKQNPEYRDLAAAVPGTTMILDHFGTPLGVGAYANRRDEIFSQWKKDMEAIAKCPNVYAKLGGMAMPDNGFGWDNNERPATSDEFVAAQQKYYLHTIECFGPERCMFESNFPPDKFSISYHVLWNAFKKIASSFTEDEQHAMFYGTAQRVYRL